ncbi:hypothetical protein FQR65_LT19604 [Abscondita terminalis]|nr:hypothetical protein FQR65_LT19604 [Abscondita terminalis]
MPKPETTVGQWRYFAVPRRTFPTERGKQVDETPMPRGRSCDTLGWYLDNAADGFQKVAVKKPNELGIYDMSGNLWEWCHDWHGDYSNSPADNPRGPATGIYRLLRGGGWNVACECFIAVDRFLMDMLSIGPYYHYIIDVRDYSLAQVSENTLKIHGCHMICNVKESLTQSNPDDLEFVRKAEAATLVKMKAIGFEHQLNLKTSYCFRMRVADGSYHLFHHQAIHLAKDEEGRMVTTLNIHTDIDHITHINSKIVLLTNISTKEEYYCQMDLSAI